MSRTDKRILIQSFFKNCCNECYKECTLINTTANTDGVGRYPKNQYSNSALVCSFLKTKFLMIFPTKAFCTLNAFLL